tara:strand:+ start:851 stop:967 length:117 start_codon:yes stop_codon:yes gene_type:complete
MTIEYVSLRSGGIDPVSDQSVNLSEIGQIAIKNTFMKH